jgi:hypothetical protein
MNKLSSKNDPLGHAVKDYYEYGVNVDIIVESDIVEDDVLPSSYFFRDLKAMPSIEKEALKKCKGKILDVGAAAGCHTIQLQDKGFDVTALEISSLCCEVMRKRGIQKIINDNFFSYSGELYDTILLMMNGIGISGTLTGLEVLLTKASQLLNKGGMLIFDSSDIDYMYYDEDGSKLINLNSNYYGELSYRMHYKNISGDYFEWLFVDFSTLMTIAGKFDFEAQLIKRGSHFDYLGILKKA